MTIHKATPEQWAMLEEFSVPEYDTTILELRTRVEALEVKYETQRLATLEWNEDVDKLKRWSDQHLQRIMKLEAQHQDKLNRLIAMDRAMPNEITLLDTITEVISNGDDAHHFRETALEAVCYAASWLRKEGFWQAADVLINEINGDYRELE